MNVDTLLEALHQKLATDTLKQLAEIIGVTESTLSNWKKNGLTEKKLANALVKSRAQAEKTLRHGMIKPIVEFYKIQPVKSLQGAKMEIFPTRDKDNATNYQKDLKTALKVSGIYIFYDSRGSALYAGKAQDQTLWDEMKNTYNTESKQQVSIFRVSHPKTSLEFRPAYEHHRQIRPTRLKLSDLAHYFSAYVVDYEMIDELEAFLIRGFPNDIFNKKMETFGKSKRKNGD